jgi:hypothetical protein
LEDCHLQVVELAPVLSVLVAGLAAAVLEVVEELVVVLEAAGQVVVEQEVVGSVEVVHSQVYLLVVHGPAVVLGQVVDLD